MPTYQYSCTECGHFLEVVQAFTDDSLTDCPECGGRLRKVFGSVGVVFKGSGFYKTDSRAAGPGESSSDSKTSSGASEKSGGEQKKSTDSTPAASGDSGASTSKSGGSATPKSA